MRMFWLRYVEYVLSILARDLESLGRLYRFMLSLITVNKANIHVSNLRVLKFLPVFLMLRYLYSNFFVSPDSGVGIAIGLRAGGSRNRGPILGRSKRIFSGSKIVQNCSGA